MTNFNDPEVQRTSWGIIHDILRNAMQAAMTAVEARFPTETPQETAFLRGMADTQLHMLLSHGVGVMERRILELTSWTEEDVKALRERCVADGRRSQPGASQA